MHDGFYTQLLLPFSSCFCLSHPVVAFHTLLLSSHVDVVFFYTTQTLMNVMKILMVVSLLVQTRKEVLTAHVPRARCSELTKRHVKMKVNLS